MWGRRWPVGTARGRGRPDTDQSKRIYSVLSLCTYLEAVTNGTLLALFPKFTFNATTESVCDPVLSWFKDFCGKSLRLDEPDG